MNNVIKEKRRLFDIGLLIIPLLFLLQSLFVSPLYEFPLNDDWVYALSVKNFYEKGIFKILGAMAANCVFHTFWGWIFVLPFGFSFSALRISTILLHLVGSLALYKLFREMEFSITWSLFSLFMIVFNPWIFQLSYTFMTDVPYLSLLAVGLLFYCRGIFRNRNVFLWIGSVFSSISFLIREMGILLPVSICFYLIFYERESLRKKILPVIGIPLVTFIGFEYWYIFIHGVTEIQAFHRDTMLRNLISPHIVFQFFERSFGVLYFIGLTSLPLSALVFVPLQRRIFHLRLKKRIFLVSLLSFIIVVAMSRYFKGDYFPIDGLWRCGSFLGVMAGSKPPVIPNGGEKILFWISVVSSCVLLSWIYIGFNEKGWGRKKTLVFILLLGFVQFCYILIAPFYFQRYFIPFIPFVILTISLYIKDSPLMRNPMIFLLVVIPAFFSVFTTKDSLCWNQSKWSTAQSLIRQGVPARNISAGYEWDCWNFYGYSKDHPHEKPKRYYPVPWWLNGFASAIDPIYKLSFSGLEGYELLNKQSYNSPLYRTPQEILVLVKKSPKTIEGFEDPKKDFTTGWNHNLQSNILQINQNTDFVSEGASSLKCDFKTNSIDTFHYGGVRVKTQMEVPGFIFDFWLLTPKEAKIIFVYCYDSDGNFTAKWFRDLVADPVREKERNTFFFLFGLSQDRFQFAGGSGGKTDYVDIFIESDDENAKVIFYVDNFRS